MALPSLSPAARRWLGAGVTLLLFCAAIWALQREVAHVAAAHLGAELARLEPHRIALAILFTALGYGVLTFYDAVGLRAIGRRLPYRAAGEAAFLSFSVSHNVGMGWLSAAAMRQRVYERHGLTLTEVVQLTVLNSVTFFIGALVLIGGKLVIHPEAVAALVPGVPDPLWRVAGVILIGIVVAYVAACVQHRESFGWRTWRVTLPSWRIAVAQVGLSSADMILAAAALYWALPASLGLDYTTVLGVWLLALSGAMLTHVPGGVGVFEALVLLALPEAARAPLLAGLIAFRCCYFLLPLAVAILWMALRGLVGLRR